MKFFAPLLLLCSSYTGFGSHVDSIVQTYFIPLPEDRMIVTFNAINDGAALSPITTILSIAIATDGTKIYYDHWEDGYDVDPANPAVGSSTLVWGDGNTGNGQQGVLDILNSGDVVILDNQVPAHPRGTDLYYDGGDRISVTLPIAITRGAYPAGAETLMAGAVEVFDVSAWGRKYVTPIGATRDGTEAFQMCHYYIMASEDATKVFVNGIYEVTLESGENMVMELPSTPGLEILSSAPVQVDLIAGDVGSAYEIRWYAQVPFEKWTNEYITPVAEDFGTTAFWIYNPSSNPITVNCDGGNIVSAVDFTIPSKSTKFFEVGVDVQVGNADCVTALKPYNNPAGVLTNQACYTGLKFSTVGTGGGSFLPIVQVDANGLGNDYDWGFPMVPSNQLSSMALVGLGYSCTDNNCIGSSPVGMDSGGDQARSVVWVTPTEDATISVTLKGVTTTYAVNALKSLRLTGSSAFQFDMTGAIISGVRAGCTTAVCVPVKIAVAWGQDPIRADTGQSKQLDLGTVVLAIPNPLLSKKVVSVTNPDNTLDLRKIVDQSGDVIQYEITVTNTGFSDFNQVGIEDLLITEAGGLVFGPVSTITAQIDQGILERAETWVYQGSYTITEADINSFRNDGTFDIENVVTAYVDGFDDSTKKVNTRIMLAKISGSVFEDVDQDTSGDEPIQNALLTLKRKNPTGVFVIIATTLTNSDGFYAFLDVEAGDYQILQTNHPLFTGDVDDKDQGDLNVININNLLGSDMSTGNYFVDERITMSPSRSPSNQPSGVRSAIPSPSPSSRPSKIASDSPSSKPSNQPSTSSSEAPSALQTGTCTGSVTSVDGSPIPNVVIQLFDPYGNLVLSTTTGADGVYRLVNIAPGDYVITEINPPGYPGNLSDGDTTPDGDAGDTDNRGDNRIECTIVPGEIDDGNNFVDIPAGGTCTGSVTSVDGSPIPNVVIQLLDAYGNVVLSTTTGADGVYRLVNIAPGDYVITEINPPGYPGNLSDGDTTPDGDAGDTDNRGDNRIECTIVPGEIDDGNNFVDIPETLTPTTIAPSTPSPVTASPIPKAPPTITTSMPSKGPDYCVEIVTPNCTSCAAYRSPDYCKSSESFPSLIQNRTVQCRTDSTAVVEEGYWFHFLEDKIAGYLLSIDQAIPAPKIFCCVTSVDKLAECLSDVVIPQGPDGIVIKATSMHSNQGVFVLVNDKKIVPDDPMDLITGLRTSYADVITALSYFQASKIIVEEFIGASLPTEYKFHVINGEVAAIDIIDGRGTECPCYAVVDTSWTRLDKFGCFEPGGFEHIDLDTDCTAIDFETGRRRAGPVKKDLNLCIDVPRLSDCLVQEMVDIALKLGARIGVAMRIDMFVEDDTIYVQEYSANHMNGIRHCAAKMDDEGCIDSCFLGRMWDDAGGPYGGNPTVVPAAIDGFAEKSAQGQCDLLNGMSPPIATKSTCSVATTAPVDPVPDFLPVYP